MQSEDKKKKLDRQVSGAFYLIGILISVICLGASLFNLVKNSGVEGWFNQWTSLSIIFIFTTIYFMWRGDQARKVQNDEGTKERM